MGVFMFKKLFGVLKTVWRWISPAADTLQAQLIRQIAMDIVQGYLTKHPDVADILKRDIFPLVDLLMKLTGIKEATADRVIRSVLQEKLEAQNSAARHSEILSAAVTKINNLSERV